MVDETGELPQAEEPTPQAEVEPKENVNDLIAELEKVGIDNPQQLQNKLEASAQVGKAFQMLGDERKTVAELQARIDKLMTQQAQPTEDQYYPEERQVNIQDEVRQGIRQEMVNMQRAQAQAHAASVQAYNFITSDKNFHLVKDVWDEKVKNPAYIAQVQSGQINPLLDYQNTVVDYFGKVAQRSLETIKKLSGSEVTPAPHVETGETHSPGNIVSSNDPTPEGVQKRKELIGKADKGHLPDDDELLEAMQSILKSG